MSEQEAERLYGPAPTGDEDPHASQAVPDPGETSGPPAPPLTAGLLHGGHLGRRVRITDGRNSATGMVHGIHHQGHLILESTLFGKDTYAMGRLSVKLDLAGDHHLRVSPGATVELLD